MQVLDQKRQFHDDTTDRDITISNILPKLMRGFIKATPTEYKYDPIDIYASIAEYERQVPIQVKSREPQYHINTFPTSDIDTTAYDDLKDWGLLVIFYPSDRKVLVYNHKELKEAYVGNVWRNKVLTRRESTGKWEYEGKYLAQLTISKGRIYDYEYFGIA